MKKETILEAITNVREDYVDEAAAPARRHRRRRTLLSAVAAVLAICLLAGGGLFFFAGNRLSANATDLMNGVKSSGENTYGTVTGEDAAAITSFGVELLKVCREEGENTLISPVSVMTALAMLSNGADGNTLAQLEDTLGLTTEELNRCFSAFLRRANEEEHHQLTLANSIWVKDAADFQPNQNFLQTNADYYQAGAFLAPFDDSTLKDINAWCSRHTDGEISEALDHIDENAVLYLINALLFEAKWEEVYEKKQVQDGIFTTEDGAQRTVSFMYSEESGWLEDENTTGFLKRYEGGQYAFVGLLPAEGLTMEEYLATLTGEKLTALLKNVKPGTVEVSMPKFRSDTSLALKDALQAMGITDAFDPDLADLSRLGSMAGGENLWVFRVIHKTTITVDEQKTKAAAITIVEAGSETTAAADPWQVNLNRPFVYLIVDTDTMTPVFLGVEMDVG